MNDLLDITDKVIAVSVVGAGATIPVDAYTDGDHFYFDDANTARVGAHLTGQMDLAGRPVRVERTECGWSELRGRQERPVHRRHIDGRVVYRFDEEWLVTVTFPHPLPVVTEVPPPAAATSGAAAHELHPRRTLSTPATHDRN